MPAAPGPTSAAAVAGGRPQPQTTLEAPGGPFIRHSQPGRRQMYNITGQSFGGVITQPLPSAPGYLQRFRVTISGSGGTSTAASVAAADAPFNVVSLVQVVDPFNTPLLVGPGYEMLKLVPKYSGQFGLDAASDITNLPSYSPVNLAAAAGGGDFSFSTALPLEFAKGYGTISMANAALLPKVTWNLASSGTVFTTAPTTLPTVGVQMDADFYWLPDGANVVPPGLGSTQQWIYQQASPTIPSGGTTTVALPRLGGYLSTLILELRDSTGARVDAWPGRIRISLDGVPLIDSTMSEIYDDMYNVFGGTTREVGVIAISRKTSLNQKNLGLLDTGETLLSTNPGTLIEIEGAPWGTATNTPVTLSAVVGQIVPAGVLIQGLPEA